MLRSSSIIAGAQVINIVASLLKVKVVAVLLGPAGVGLAGLYLNLIQTASALASLGTGAAGTRQIAAAHATGEAIALARTGRALLLGNMALAAASAGLFFLASGWIARFVLDKESVSADVAWLSIGVALTVAAGSQVSMLAGLRRVGDLARINLGTGVVGAALGVAALWLWGTGGLLAMILVVPAVSFLLGHVQVARLALPAGGTMSWRELWLEWRALVTLGFAFMLSGLVTTAGDLAIRTLVQRDLGLESLGHFQAAWAIGVTYIGFVLGAMGTDYYPRLTAVIGDRDAAARLVNEQTEVALLLCAPVVVAMLGFAPWVIRLMYSGAFEPAVDILRWQLLGDIPKVMSWPLGYILLAAGAGRTFVLTETLAMCVFVSGVAIGLPRVGVTATGVAFLALYAFYLPLVRWLGGRRIGFRWTPAVKAQAAAVMIAALAVEGATRWSDATGAIVGAAIASALAIWALIRLSSRAEIGGRLGDTAALGEQVRRWIKARF